MSMRDKALRTAALKALLDEVKKAYDAARLEADAALIDLNDSVGASTVQVKLPGAAAAVAQISLGEPKTVFRIDEAGFLAYCQRECPTEVQTIVHEPETIVRPAWRTALLKRLTVEDDKVVDTGTGRVLEFIEVAEPGPPSTTLTWKTGGREQVAQAYRDGRLALAQLLALAAAEE